jgi:hypothetical protein
MRPSPATGRLPEPPARRHRRARRLRRRPCPDASFLHPTAVLFNGGVLKSGLIAERVLNPVNGWLAPKGRPGAPARRRRPRPRRGPRCGLLRLRAARRGVRIRGGTAQAYYVAVESAMPAIPGMEPPIQALCLAPFGMEEGSEAALPAQEFGLVVGEPVRFRFFGSSVRRQDQVGTLLDFWAPTNCRSSPKKSKPACRPKAAGRRDRARQLHARITETGTRSNSKPCRLPRERARLAPCARHRQHADAALRGRRGDGPRHTDRGEDRDGQRVLRRRP